MALVAITFKTEADMRRAVGALKARGFITFKTETDMRRAVGAHKAHGFVVHAAVKHKKYKERLYDVRVGPTKGNQNMEIAEVIKRASPFLTSNMKLASEVTLGHSDVHFQVQYGARGGCPSDVRRLVKRSLFAEGESTATVTVNTHVPVLEQAGTLLEVV